MSMLSMRAHMHRADDLFFDLTPVRVEGLLDVGDQHKIHWCESGSGDGVPMVSCHGGPGGAMMGGVGRFTDGRRVRLIQFDQRGCGRSIPHNGLHSNTLQHTIADMERLRRHLGVERWIVSGGSWGSTVALAYAQRHPERCLGLFLVSLWLCRRADTQWWFHGVRSIFPELWDEFAAFVPETERGDLRKAYCRRILGDNVELAAEAATRLYLYEEGFMHFDAPLAQPNPGRGADYGRVFAHYAQNDFFVDDDELLRNADRLRAVPISIVTGRYDCCTTPANAWDFKQRAAHAALEIVPGAGHYPTEPVFARAVARAAQQFVRDIEKREGRA
jgi:proline iminopeptidase